MPERPTITLVDNPTAIGDPRRPHSEVREDEAKRPKRSPPRREPSKAAETPTNDLTTSEAAPQPDSAASTNPYAGLRKVQAPVRLFPPLWDRLDELVRELQSEGHEVDKTALLNATLHFHGPATVTEARELTNRWRALLALPPKRD